jgi:spore germination cell wall hydrolase CwlJ-like protein
MIKIVGVLTRTAHSEARGEPEAGQAAVVWVIRNRAEKDRTSMGKTIKEVCPQSNQFFLLEFL